MNTYTRYKNICHLLVCPDCKANYVNLEEAIKCGKCGRNFSGHGKFLEMLPKEGLPLPEMYSDLDYVKFIEVYDEVLDYHYLQDNIVSKINRVYHRIFRSILKNNCIKTNGFYLDVGCGNGSHWEDKVFQGLIGLDISNKALEVMGSRYPSVPLIRGDLCSLPFADKSLDGVFALAVLEHIYYLEHAIEELYRVLKPDGKLILSIPAEGGMLWKTGRKLTTDRYFRRKYGIDHARVVKITHCNTARKVIKNLLLRFKPIKLKYDPFQIPVLDLNLFFSGIFCKRK